MKLYIDFYDRNQRAKNMFGRILLLLIVITFIAWLLALFIETKAQSDPLYKAQTLRLADLRVNETYTNLDFYKLNPKINYYGKNINQIVITVKDTLQTKTNSLIYYVWSKYITVSKVDSLVIRITENWKGTFEEWK